MPVRQETNSPKESIYETFIFALISSNIINLCPLFTTNNSKYIMIIKLEEKRYADDTFIIAEDEGQLINIIKKIR